MTDSGLTTVKNTNILSFRSGSMGRDARKNNKKDSRKTEECMMSIDDARRRQQIKRIGIRKTSKGINNIPLMTSAFQRVHPSTSEGCEASPVIKERGHQEAIKMAAEVQEWNKREPCSNAGGNLTQKPSILTEMSSESSLIEDRKQKQKKVLEQFLREAKRQGRLTESMEARKMTSIDNKKPKNRGWWKKNAKDS